MEDCSATPGRRAAGYWFVDGLPELVFGAGLAAWGGLGFVYRMYMPYRGMKIAFAAFGLLFLALTWKWRWFLDFLKSRTTYPRTGYVQPPFEEPADDSSMIRLFAPSQVNENVTGFYRRVIVLFYIAWPWPSWIDARWGIGATMTGLTAAAYLLNRESERPFSFWSVVPLALAGVAASLANVPTRAQEYLPATIGGIWLLVQGVWKFSRYLSGNPISAGGGVRA